jgi:dCMP deaminase
MMSRPELDDYFMEIAEVVASRSTCLRRKAGAIFVKDKQILSTGYNGVPKGLPHCEETGCPRANLPSGTHHELCRAVHSEQNAIVQAAIHGVCIEGATLYCTHKPCTICTKMLINAGIRRVVYRKDYPDDGSLKFFEQSGIVVRKLQNICKI